MDKYGNAQGDTRVRNNVYKTGTGMLRSCSLLFSDDGERGELCSDQLSLVTERAAVNPGLGTALFSQPLLSTHNNNHHIIQRLINTHIR